MSRQTRGLVTSLALCFQQRRAAAWRQNQTDKGSAKTSTGLGDTNELLTKDSISLKTRPNVGEHESHQP